MSLIWEHTDGSNHYSVRRAGASIRLYTNRVFHSQWNPRRAFAGGVWDCLSLPVLYRPLHSIKRVLLLGVGGGAVIRQLQVFDLPVHITAVDIDAWHLKIARDFFQAEGENVTLIHAEACAWLSAYSGPPFDVIIDDLFGHQNYQPQRAVALEQDWLDCLYSHLDTKGLLIVNCVSAKDMTGVLPIIGVAGFVSACRWYLPAYDNVIGVFSRHSLQTREWSRQLEICGLDKGAQRQARLIVRRPLHGLTL